MDSASDLGNQQSTPQSRLDSLHLPPGITIQGWTRRKITQLYASLYESANAIQAVNELQTVLPTYDVSAPKAEAVQRIQGQTTGFQIGLNVMIGVSLVVCSFIVFNTLYMTVSERTYEIGIIRAIGGSRAQIFKIFFAEGGLIGALGTVAGILGGLGLGRLFTIVFETTFALPNTNVNSRARPSTLTITAT